MSLSPDEQSANPAPAPQAAEALDDGRASVPVEAARGAGGHFDEGVSLAAGNLANIQPVETALPAPDPAWNGWDVLRLIRLTIIALVVGVFAVLLIAHVSIYPHRRLGEIAGIPLVVVAGQSLAYLLILAYMYFLVTRKRHRPDFLAAIHWNWPARSVLAGCLLGGAVLSVALQILAHFLPIPKELPIDSFFQTPAEAWALSILSITLAPLMEELFFRGFLYPVLARSLGLPLAVFLTALGFAALHGMQLMFSWGPVLVIFLVGVVLTLVRAKTNSVASGVLIHMAYNGTITAAMFAATDGFRHLEKLNQ
ncbi:MAG: type II CAAX endopeptidase family protein [Terriglobales bacterium]